MKCVRLSTSVGQAGGGTSESYPDIGQLDRDDVAESVADLNSVCEVHASSSIRTGFLPPLGLSTWLLCFLFSAAALQPHDAPQPFVAASQAVC